MNPELRSLTRGMRRWWVMSGGLQAWPESRIVTIHPDLHAKLVANYCHDTIGSDFWMQDGRLLFRRMYLEPEINGRTEGFFLSWCYESDLVTA